MLYVLPLSAWPTIRVSQHRLLIGPGVGPGHRRKKRYGLQHQHHSHHITILCNHRQHNQCLYTKRVAVLMYNVLTGEGGGGQTAAEVKQKAAGVIGHVYAMCKNTHVYACVGIRMHCLFSFVVLDGACWALDTYFDMQCHGRCHMKRWARTFFWKASDSSRA